MYFLLSRGCIEATFDVTRRVVEQRDAGGMKDVPARSTAYLWVVLSLVSGTPRDKWPIWLDLTLTTVPTCAPGPRSLVIELTHYAG